MRIQIPQLAINIEKAELRSLNEQQVCGPETSYLPSQFRSDRATASGDHHRLACQEFSNAIQVELNGFSTKEIFDLHIADATDFHMTLQDLVESGNDANLDRHLLTNLNDALDVRARSLGNSDND